LLLGVSGQFFETPLACQTFTDLSGNITLNSGDFSTTCWQLVPSLGLNQYAGKEPASVVLTFESYDFQGNSVLNMYSGYENATLYLEKTLGAVNGTVPVTLSGGIILLQVAGSGLRTFTLTYNAVGVRNNLSLQVFYALLVILLIPFGCMFPTCLSCLPKCEPKKKTRLQHILFVSSVLLGSIFFILFLTRAI